ncbi:hypothetical protein [Streptomyces sp. NPDC055210]
MRQLMEASGLTFAQRYHLASLFLALDATELLGRVVSGSRGTPGAGRRLRAGVQYLIDQRDPQVLPRPLLHTPDEYVDLRNFTGHGAAQLSPDVAFEPESTSLLLRYLAHVLNTMWADPDLPANLAEAEIHPVFSTVGGALQPVLVPEIREHLKHSGPGDGLDHDGWRYDIATVDNSSPPVSGTGFSTS